MTGRPRTRRRRLTGALAVLVLTAAVTTGCTNDDGVITPAKTSPASTIRS